MRAPRVFPALKHVIVDLTETGADIEPELSTITQVNISIFLGLALPYNANNPNTLINGSVEFSFSVTDSNNNVLNNSISFPTFDFTFNRSQISNTTSNIELLPPLYDQFANSMPINTTFNFTRSEYNFGSATNNWGIVDGVNVHAIDNGSVSMFFNKSYNGFSLGRMYDPSNNSFTSVDVPVGYPFSFMVLPANLTLDQFKNIFHTSFGPTLDSFNAVFFNTSDTLAVSMGMNIQSGVYSFQYLYNKTSGALMYFKYNRTIQYTQFEELQLDGSSIYPINTPLFTTQDHNQSDQNIMLDWQSQGQDITYAVLLNGTVLTNQASTSLNYTATNPGLYEFQLRAINKTSGLISPVSLTVLINVTQTTQTSNSTTSSQSSSISTSQISSTDTSTSSNTSTSPPSSVDFNFNFFLLAMVVSYALVGRRRNK